VAGLEFKSPRRVVPDLYHKAIEGAQAPAAVAPRERP
jgi:hypothetical protein